MNNELDKYYELLGVAPGASAQELKDAYRDLAKVWHPDRFSHDPRLQQKAQEKLKEINEAYARLTNAKAGRRTRTASAPAQPQEPAPATVRRRRPRLVPATAAVFCAVFIAAFSSIVPSGRPTAPAQTSQAEREEARPPAEAQQPDGGARADAGTPARGKERTARQLPADETSGGDAAAKPASPVARPLETVTVTIDVANGMLATRDCPTVGRMTYPAGGQPRQHCTAPHKTKVASQGEPQGSRLKSIGKRLSAPFK